jgi:hypothetical protein
VRRPEEGGLLGAAGARAAPRTGGVATGISLIAHQPRFIASAEREDLIAAPKARCCVRTKAE